MLNTKLAVFLFPLLVVACQPMGRYSSDPQHPPRPVTDTVYDRQEPQPEPESYKPPKDSPINAVLAKRAKARQEYVENHPDLSSEILEAIRNNKCTIILGMPRDAILLWDDFPVRKSGHRDVGSWGVKETWVCQDGLYLFFENGVLTSWSE
jgi:hypothetical protein